MTIQSRTVQSQLHISNVDLTYDKSNQFEQKEFLYPTAVALAGIGGENVYELKSNNRKLDRWQRNRTRKQRRKVQDYLVQHFFDLIQANHKDADVACSNLGTLVDPANASSECMCFSDDYFDRVAAVDAAAAEANAVANAAPPSELDTGGGSGAEDAAPDVDAGTDGAAFVNSTSTSTNTTGATKGSIVGPITWHLAQEAGTDCYAACKSIAQTCYNGELNDDWLLDTWSVCLMSHSAV